MIAWHHNEVHWAREMSLLMMPAGQPIQAEFCHNAENVLESLSCALIWLTGAER